MLGTAKEPPQLFHGLLEPPQPFSRGEIEADPCLAASMPFEAGIESARIHSAL